MTTHQSCVNNVIQTSTPSIAILAPDLVQAFFVPLDIHHEATSPELYFLCLCWNLIQIYHTDPIFQCSHTRLRTINMHPPSSSLQHDLPEGVVLGSSSWVKRWLNWVLRPMFGVKKSWLLRQQSTSTTSLRLVFNQALISRSLSWPHTSKNTVPTMHSSLQVAENTKESLNDRDSQWTLPTL